MNPVTHIEYPRLWSVDITVASGILITPAFCLLSRPERGVCRCLCPCCLPSGTLRIRDSLLFRERSAPASPILFPSSHLRLHCGACRQCHAAPLFRLQMLTCRRALAALRALPSLATCRREACGTDSSPRTADDTTSGCTQCLSRPLASGTTFPPIRSVWQPGSSVPQSFGFAMHSTLARSSGKTPPSYLTGAFPSSQPRVHCIVFRLHACRHLIRPDARGASVRRLMHSLRSHVRLTSLAPAPNCNGMPERDNLQPSDRHTRSRTCPHSVSHPPRNHTAEWLKLLEHNVRNITVHREMNEPIATFSRDRLVTARPRWRGAIAECLELEDVHGNLLFAYSLHTSCIFRYSEESRAVLKSGRAGVSLRYLGGNSPKPHCKGLKFRTFAISSLYIFKFFLQFQSVMCVFTLILCRLRSRLVCCPGMGFRSWFMH